MRIADVVLIAVTFLAATDVASSTPASQFLKMTPGLSPVFAFADIHNGKRFLRTDTTEMRMLKREPPLARFGRRWSRNQFCSGAELVERRIRSR
ncbi:hypothetical protein PI124_g22038 [Phytophthora idaei]|nr:hypothetical protein PI125_g23846 [Phytophthora idaei]KAG3127783.1 hypothetical protein PI126_g21702 [Phytophthora idaei]KAG3232884.1 hypothetical protein PI124_g22038 [Phytophthora idaei]